MRSRLGIGLFLFALTLSISAPAAAQPADVTGFVRDTSGAVLPGATIDATIAGLSVATTTAGSDGRYRLALAAGTLQQLRAKMNGFADEAVELRPAAGSTTHDFTLRIAAVADDVVVTASRIPESRSTTTESLAVWP